MRIFCDFGSETNRYEAHLVLYLNMERCYMYAWLKLFSYKHMRYQTWFNETCTQDHVQNDVNFPVEVMKVVI